MSKMPSKSDEPNQAPTYEKPALKEYGTLLELTLSGAQPGVEKGPIGGGSSGSV